MVAPINLELLHGSNTKDVRPVRFGISDNIVLTDSFADAVAIYNAHLSLTTITIYNKHATNSLDYSIFGHLDENAQVQPTFSGEWTELPKDDCITTVAGQKSKGETLSENWAWILIRIKNTTAGQNATAKVTVRSRQSRN